MMDNRFEQAFGEYLDSTECDEIEDTLFAAIRNAFLAGWKAAGAACPCLHAFLRYSAKRSSD